MSFKKEHYFQRQITLTEIGKEGQDLLQKAKVLVIGCGGLGSPIAIYLATSGVGALHLVDYDTIAVSNLHRQVFFRIEDILQPKVEVLASEIKKRAPFTKVSFSNYAVDKNSIKALIAKYDIVVDGTDSLPIKYLINDACVLAKKPLVYGSLYKFDGYVSTFNMLSSDGEYTCNLRDAFPEMMTNIPNCEEAGTLNPIVGIIALLQANEVIKLKKNNALNFKDIFKNTHYIDTNCTIQDSALLIPNSELKKRLRDKDIEIVSVINKENIPIPFEVHQKITYATFNAENFVPDFKKYYVIVCNKGITSYDVTLKLKEKYPSLSVFSLYEGIEKY